LQEVTREIQILKELYWDKGLSALEVAHTLGISETKTLNLMRKYNIPRRTLREAHTLSTAKGYKRKRVSVSPETIRKLYWEENKTASEIGAELGLCGKYISHLMTKYGIPKRTHSEVARLALSKVDLPKGPQTPQWKGGRYRRHGYIYVKAEGHPQANKNGYVPEHLIVWEKTHNKRLPKGWVIHHLNGIRDDNHPDNLVALPNREHNRLLKIYGDKIKTLQEEVVELFKAIEHYQTRDRYFIYKEANNG